MTSGRAERYYPVLAYGGDPSGAEDSSSALVAAMREAALTNAPVELPPGTFICNGASSPVRDTGWLEIRGAGRGATVLRANVAGGQTLTLGMPGSISDLTVDGGGVTTNGLALVPNASAFCSRQELHRVTARNISSTGQWVLIAWNNYGPNNDGVIGTLVLDDVAVEGPSNPATDAMAIASGGDVFVSNMRISGVVRSPNFFTIRRLFIRGLVAEAWEPAPSGEADSYDGVIVIDSGVNEARVSDMDLRDESTLAVNCPRFYASRCSFTMTIYALKLSQLPGQVATFRDCEARGGYAIYERMESLRILGGSMNMANIVDFSPSGTEHGQITVDHALLSSANVMESFDGTSARSLNVSGCAFMSPGRMVDPATVTDGSTTLTCSTGSFISTDVGRVLTDSAGFIPAGTTISSITSATEVVMSAAATGTSDADQVALGALYYPGNMIHNFTAPIGGFRDNLGLNPVGNASVAVPASGTATAPLVFDATFTVTANASGSCSLEVSGAVTTTVTVPAGGALSVFVPAFSTVTPTYTDAPTWTVQGH